MAKIISFEGPIGAGKTTLARYFSTELKIRKVLEHSMQNPFIRKFYKHEDVNLETEITFLLMHFSLLKKIVKMPGIVLTDFSIEKDLVFATMNLKKEELEIFNNCYSYVIEKVGNPNVTIYLNLPWEFLWQRMLKRGRAFEVDFDNNYFKTYADRLNDHFMNFTKSSVMFVDCNKIGKLPLNIKNETLSQIKRRIDMI
jgi:deoxyguanosine kinase